MADLNQLTVGTNAQGNVVNTTKVLTQPTIGGQQNPMIMGGNTIMPQSNPNNPLTVTNPPTGTITPSSVVNSEQAVEDVNKKQTNLNDITQQVADQKQNVLNNQNVQTGSAQLLSVMISKGLTGSYAEQTQLAKQYGITNYYGTDAQKAQLATAIQTADASKPVKTKEELDAEAKAKANAQAIGDFTGKGEETGTGTTTYNDWSDTKTSGVNYFKNVNGVNFGIPEPPAGYKVQYNSEGQTREVPMTQDEISAQSTNNFLNETDQAYTDYSNKINQIQNGTFPLTAEQQAQVDALQRQFDTLRQQQIIANKNYTGGVTEAGIAAGRNRYATEIESGNIKASVDQGIQKLADLDAKASAAIAQMKQGFLDNDYKMVNDSYVNYNNYIKQKSDAIQKIADTAYQHEQDLKKYNYTAAQDEIANIFKSETLDWQEKQDAIKNTLDQAQLDETKRHNLQTEVAALGNQAINNQVLPSVKMTSEGLPDKATQAEFLAQFPQDIATDIKMIANYQMNPSAFATRQYKGVGNVTQSQILAWVGQYDPTYNQAQYASRQALLTNFASGKYSQNVNSLNTAIGHLNDLVDNFAKLGNEGLTPYNYLKNKAQQAFGAGGITSAESNITAATNELATVFKGSGATDQEINAWKNTMSTSASPEQAKAFIETAITLLNSRLEALNGTYTSGMGKPKEGGFLSDKNQQALLMLKAKGYDVQISELANSPYVKLQNFHDSSAENASIIDQIKQLAPDATPQEVIDLLAEQNISL